MWMWKGYRKIRISATTSAEICVCHGKHTHIQMTHQHLQAIEFTVRMKEAIEKVGGDKSYRKVSVSVAGKYLCHRSNNNSYQKNGNFVKLFIQNMCNTLFNGIICIRLPSSWKRLIHTMSLLFCVLSNIKMFDRSKSTRMTWCIAYWKAHLNQISAASLRCIKIEAWTNIERS